MSSGKITQVVGPVVDVAFAAEDKLPEINNALVVYKNDDSKQKVVLEVALELGDRVIRTIAMESTDGLTRGMEVLDTGRPISVPVGKETLGRVFNVLGIQLTLRNRFRQILSVNRFTKRLLLLMNYRLQMKFWKQVLKLLIF